MATDNVDIWKKIIFRIPETQKIVTGLIVLGGIYSILMYLGLKSFTSIPFDHSAILLIASFIFILPSIISAELLHRFIPDYPRKWSYFLALSNQLILFIYSLILTGADNFLNAWNVLWLAIITIYLSTFFVLLLTVGYKYIKRISLLSLTCPAVILAAFHLFLGRLLQISFLAYLTNFGVLVFAAVLLIATFLITEFFIRTNVSNVSVLGLTSGLLQKRQEALNLGYPTKPDVQTLEVRNQTGKAQIAVPWIHPGPLEGFGGGEITTNIINHLNKDGEGFFLHVPSTHKSDPTDPQDYKKIIDAMENPQTYSKASQLLKKEHGEITFYGRKVNGQKIVYMESPYDDYEISVFKEILDLDETILVDLHNQERELQGNREEVWYNTETAELLRKNLLDFIEVLDQQPIHDYNVGFKSDSEDTKIFSLVEEVDDQTTVLFGIEGNEAGLELQQLEEEYSDRFDTVLVFTTDTHRSIHDLSREEQVTPNRIRKTVEEATKNVSSGQLGFTSRKAEKMKILREDYSGLIFSINILVRLIPLTLILLYLGLIIWVL